MDDRFNTPQIVRAAVIAELTDGTRMLYEFQPGMPLTFEMEREEMMSWAGARIRYLPMILTVSGTFSHGTVWTGPAPFTEPDAISVGQKEIEG